MSKDPAVLFFTSDFLSGTSFFTMEERGQYITLLCEQHQLYSIPPDHLKKICGSSNSPVAKKFKIDPDGNYYNQRMREESEKRKLFCESRRKSIKQRYVRNTCVAHTKIRMENGNGNGNEDGSGDIQQKNLKEGGNGGKEPRQEIKEILDYLNAALKTHYRSDTGGFINARLEEGYTPADFKIIIDKKTKAWLYDNKMQKFLRPITLFSPEHFVTYLNEIDEQSQLKERIKISCLPQNLNQK